MGNPLALSIAFCLLCNSLWGEPEQSHECLEALLISLEAQGISPPRSGCLCHGWSRARAEPTDLDWAEQVEAARHLGRIFW